MPVRHDDAVQLLRYSLGATPIATYRTPGNPGGSSVTPKRRTTVDENENNAWEPQNLDDSPAYPEHPKGVTPDAPPFRRTNP
jgi:hypothetical protein